MNKWGYADGILLVSILIDVVSMNVYRDFRMAHMLYEPGRIASNYIYFSGQSLAYTGLIYFATLVTKERFATHLICVYWLSFALWHTIKTMFMNNTAPGVMDFMYLAVATTWALIQLRKKGYV